MSKIFNDSKSIHEYEKVILTFTNVLTLLKNNIFSAPRQCIVCGKLAGWECAECFGDHGEGLDSTAFCETCLTRVHNHMKRRKHKMNQLKVPQEYVAQG